MWLALLDRRSRPMPSRRTVLVTLAAVGVALGLSPLPRRLDDLLTPQGYGDVPYGMGSYGGLGGDPSDYATEDDGPWPPGDR